MGGMRPGAANPLLKKKKEASSESRELDNSAILDRPTRARPGSIRKAKQFEELISDNSTDDSKFDQSMSYTAEPSQQTETKENETDAPKSDETEPPEDDTPPDEPDTQTTIEDASPPEQTDSEPIEAKDDTEQPKEDAPPDDAPQEEAEDEVAPEQTNSESIQTKDDAPSEPLNDEDEAPPEQTDSDDAKSTEEKKEAEEEEDKEVEILFEKLDEAECESLLKKYLSKEIFDRLKSTRTEEGCDFKSCVRSGIDNLDSGVGVYASDADAYNVFSALLHT
eukprot:259421_1